MPGRPFKKGKDPRRAKGGARPGAGRKPDEFKEKMRAIASSKQALKFVEDLVNGADVDEFITQQGECIPHRAKAETRLRGLEFAADRGYGKPTQAHEVTGEIGIDIVELVNRAERERGLPLTEIVEDDD